MIRINAVLLVVAMLLPGCSLKKLGGKLGLTKTATGDVVAESVAGTATVARLLASTRNVEFTADDDLAELLRGGFSSASSESNNQELRELLVFESKSRGVTLNTPLVEELVVLQRGGIAFYFPYSLVSDIKFGGIKPRNGDFLATVPHDFSAFPKGASTDSSTPQSVNYRVELSLPLLEKTYTREYSGAKAVSFFFAQLAGEKLPVENDSQRAYQEIDGLILARVFRGRPHLLILPTSNFSAIRKSPPNEIKTLQSFIPNRTRFTDNWSTELRPGDKLQLVNLNQYLPAIGLRF